MCSRGSIMILLWFALNYVMATAASSGCQHSCDCGFAADGLDEELTLRYEVMAGLVGAFAPLTLAGLGYLTHKLCTRPPSPTTSLPAPRPNGGWQGEGGGGNKGNRSMPYGQEPTSVYGESDDEMPPERENRRGMGGGGRGVRPNSNMSRYTNIHANVKSDMTNQWLRNVNLRNYWNKTKTVLLF